MLSRGPTNLQATTMTLDSSKFDKWIKTGTHRDLMFRAAIWTIVALSGARLAIGQRATVDDYCIFCIESVFPFVRTVDGFVAVIAILAILSKDLAIIHPLRFGELRWLGKVGMVVRRVASDLCLWVLGGYSTILTAITLSLVNISISNSSKFNPWKLAEFLSVEVMVPLAIFLLITYFVRDGRESPIIRLTSTRFGLTAIYCSLAVAVLLGHAFSLAIAPWSPQFRIYPFAFPLRKGLSVIAIFSICLFIYISYEPARVKIWLVYRYLSIPKSARGSNCLWCGSAKVFCRCQQRYCIYCRKQTTQHLVWSPSARRCHTCIRINT